MITKNKQKNKEIKENKLKIDFIINYLDKLYLLSNTEDNLFNALIVKNLMTLENLIKSNSNLFNKNNEDKRSFI